MNLKERFLNTFDSERLLSEFAKGVLKLTPEEFLGLVQCLGLKMVDESKKPISGEDMVVDVCNSFAVRPLRQKKQLLKLVNDTVGLRAMPKFNAEEQAQRDSEYEVWLAEQRENMKKLNEEVAAVGNDMMEDENGAPTKDREEK